ncbi:type II secretion system protein [Denitratisoma oestradiolicum]|uniref:type II secretion system protein n=1 Tax=Denitratisoma oestradiolicum TaxID=311182 RepID=UPI0011A3A4F1|nr:type II secretion system protein [Denitratisoma oestradiolicum]TWO79996.1 type II secretion system protein G [Denitratisoma oestradiolicum]
MVSPGRSAPLGPPPLTGDGFTLIELLVVLAIIAVLLTIAVPRYFHSVDRSKDVVLIENLRVVRETIDKFYGDTGRYPESLEELVERKYLRSLPRDPVTDRDDSWVLLPPEGDAKGNIYDVKSGATGQTQDGKAYKDL